MNPVILITWFGLLLVLPNQANGYEDLENFDPESDKYLDQENIIPQEKISDGNKISSSNKHYDLKEFPLNANFLTEEIDEGSDESDSPEFTSINDLIASQSIDTLAFTDNDFAISSNLPTSSRSGSYYNSNTPVSSSNDIPASHRSIDPTSSSSDFSFDIKPLSNSYTGPLSTQNALNPIKSNSQSFSSNEISFNSNAPSFNNNALPQRNPGLSLYFGAPSAGSIAPSASGYAPSPEINIQSFDSNIHQFSFNDPSFSSNTPQFSNNDPSFNSNIPQFSNNDPSFNSNIPQFSNNDPSFNSNIFQFGNNDPSFSINIPQFSNNDPSFNSNIPQLSKNDPSFNRNIPQISNNDPSFNSIIPQISNNDPSFNSNIPQISNNAPFFSSNIPPFPNNAPSFNPTLNVNTPNFINTPSLQSYQSPLQSINPNTSKTISSSFKKTALSYNSNTPELNSNNPATFNGNDYTFKYGNGKFNRFNAIDITQLHKSIGKSYINIDQPSGRNAQYSEGGSAQSLRSNDDHSIGNAQSFGNNKNLGTIDQFSGWSDQHFGAKDQSFGSNGQFFSNNIDFGAKDKFNEGHGQFSASNQDPSAPGKRKLYNFVIKEKSPSLEHIVSNNPFSHETVVEHANPQGYDAQSYDQPAPYAYEYAVEDSYHGTKFSAQENSDLSGNVVGSYSVLLPDGRTQYVNYNAAHGQGFVASVSYVDHSGSGSSSNSISSGKSNLEHNKHLKTIPSLIEGTVDHVSILPSFTQKTGANYISLSGKSNPGRIKYKSFSV